MLLAWSSWNIQGVDHSENTLIAQKLSVHAWSHTTSSEDDCEDNMELTAREPNYGIFTNHFFS